MLPHPIFSVVCQTIDHELNFTASFRVQITELEAEFEKLPSGKPIQTRFLRSQQDLREKLEAEAAAAAAAGEEEGEDDDGQWHLILHSCLC